MNSLSFVADATIASLTGATAEDLPAGFGVAQRLNLITADLNGLTDAINKLTGFLQSGAGANGTGTQAGVNAGSVAASNSGTVTAAASGAPDLGALAPLIGDVAILGVDMTASPFAMTQTVTRAIAAASTDLGAGDMQAAQTAFTNILQTGLAETQTRIAEDQSNIGAALARLMGQPSTTTSQAGAANSVTGATSVVAATKTTSRPAVQSHPTNMGPGPVVTKPTSSTPAAVHGSAPSTVSAQGSSHTPGTTATTTRQGSDTAGATKPSTPSPTKAGGRSTRARPPRQAAAPTPPARPSTPLPPNRMTGAPSTASTDPSTASLTGSPTPVQRGARQCFTDPEVQRFRRRLLDSTVRRFAVPPTSPVGSLPQRPLPADPGRRCWDRWQ